MKTIHRSHLAAAGLVLLAGCVTAPLAFAQVGVQEVDSAVPKDTRMTLAPNETFQQPLPAASNALPAYPDTMLSHQLPPQAVCVRVSIDEEGAVSATAPIGAGPDCPAESNAAAPFYDAAQAATTGWRFDPAFRCVAPKGEKPPKHGCYGDDVEEVPQAVSLVYRFVFEQIDGKGSVHLAR